VSARDGSERFRRAKRLRSSKDFSRISREGMRVAGRSFVVLMADQRTGERDAARLGITVSRRVGPAVVRTRVKRQVREWFRRRATPLPAGKDLVVIARSGAAHASHAAVVRDLEGALDGLARRAGGA